MEKFKFLTQAGLNYISYNTKKLYRYTSVYLVEDASYMPYSIGNDRWKEFERSFYERLRNLVIRNTINSGLGATDLHVAILSIINWIKELRDNQAETLGFKTLSDEKVIEKEVYEKIKHILNFVMEQRKQYIFEQTWKDWF